MIVSGVQKSVAWFDSIRYSWADKVHLPKLVDCYDIYVAL